MHAVFKLLTYNQNVSDDNSNTMYTLFYNNDCYVIPRSIITYNQIARQICTTQSDFIRQKSDGMTQSTIFHPTCRTHQYVGPCVTSITFIFQRDRFHFN